MSAILRCFFLTLSLGLISGCQERVPARSEQMQEGFVVWESSRTGSWRIFKQDLNAKEAVQISPEEEGRDHVAAHVSPDGTRVLYLSYPRGRNGYRKQPSSVRIPMWMVDLTSDEPPQELIPNARPYGEHRAAVWLSNHEIAYIDNTYRTKIHNLETGKSRMWLGLSPEGSSWDHGFLPSPTLKHVTTGLPQLFDFIGQEDRPALKQDFEGCQPLFTRDGSFFYYMAGMGGPIRALDLSTKTPVDLLKQNDERLPEGWRYLYFPHISPDRSLLVYAASDGSHDHHTSDYELFLLPLNPETLAVAGDPIRFTEHEATDRFPEVWRPAPLPESQVADVPPPPEEEPPFLLWDPAENIKQVRFPGRSVTEALQTRRTGLARFHAHGDLQVGKGSWVIPGGGALFSQSSGFVVQMTMTLSGGTEGHHLMSFSDSRVQLVTKNSRLALLSKDEDPQFLSDKLPMSKPVHVALEVQEGMLQAYVNGEPGPRVPAPAFPTEGDWMVGSPESEDLLLARLEWSAGPLTTDVLKQKAEEAQRRVTQRDPIPRRNVRARLQEQTTPPTLEEITPYRESLVLNEYVVLKDEAGAKAGERIRVWQWALLDGNSLPLPKAGQEVNLLIEPKASHAWIETLNRVDDLSFSVDVPEWVDVPPL